LGNNKLNIDVVAFDAGGAELLSSMVKHESGKYNWRLIASDNSPAKVIFERKNLSKLIYNKSDSKSISNLWDRSKPDYLFCGTSTNGYELPFIIEARRRGISSVAFLDHWINYRERFGYPETDWEKNKPDFFALSDNRAYAKAGELNLGPPLRIKNYYIADLLSVLGRFKADVSKKKSLLFISEAIEEHCRLKYNDPGYEGYTQTQVLTEVLDSFQSISEKWQIENIIIRLHPAEAPDKFDYLKNNFPDIEISIEKPGDKPLNESVATAKAVIGIKSMALLIAFLLNKPVLSYLPIDQQCSLPLPEKCCTNDLRNIPILTNIPRFEADGGLFFYEEFPLAKMLADIKKGLLNYATH